MRITLSEQQYQEAVGAYEQLQFRETDAKRLRGRLLSVLARYALSLALDVPFDTNRHLVAGVYAPRTVHHRNSDLHVYRDTVRPGVIIVRDEVNRSGYRHTYHGWVYADDLQQSWFDEATGKFIIPAASFFPIEALPTPEHLAAQI